MKANYVLPLLSRLRDPGQSSGQPGYQRSRPVPPCVQRAAGRRRFGDLSQLAEKIPVYAYQTQNPVIAGDNRLTFPIGDILEDVSRGMLAGESLSALMEEMDQKAAARQE